MNINASAADPASRSTRGRPRRAWVRRPSSDALLGLLGVVCALGLWELLTRTGILPRDYVPAATSIIGELVDLLPSGEFWRAVGATLLGAVVGLALASVVGIAVGMAAGSSEIVWRSLRPTVEFLRPVPAVALVPASALMFGQSVRSDVFLVAFGTVFIMFVQTMYGVREVDRVAVDTGRSYHLTRVQRVRWIILPSTMPHIVTGLQISGSVALIVAVTAELVIGNEGLGHSIALAQSAGQLTSMYALIAASGLLGVAVFVGLGRLERHFVAWHQSQRRGA